MAPRRKKLAAELASEILDVTRTHMELNNPISDQSLSICKTENYHLKKLSNSEKRLSSVMSNLNQ
jgi:hypothetical protein